MAKRIFGIVYTHENNALFCSSLDYNIAFRALGYDADIADVTTPAGTQILNDALNSGEVAFCYGLQGIGSNLIRNNTNLWGDTKVPFIGLHYDNPCYNIHNHGNDSRWVANIYHAGVFLDIQRRYIGGDQINLSLPFRITAEMADSDIPFAQREIKYLFLKTGERIEEFTEYFNSLPPPLRDGVWDIAYRAAADPNLILCDLVHSLLVKCGYDPVAYRTQFWAVVQSLDYYLRRKRAIDMVEWLKMQEGAVIVGRGWDFIDREGARASFRPPLPLEEAIYLYAQTQFVCNTNPYGSDIVHERIISGLMRHCCVISDSNNWWDKNFSDVPALLRVDMDKSLDMQILPFVADDAAARAAIGRGPALQHFAPQDNYAHIVACADQIHLHATSSV